MDIVVLDGLRFAKDKKTGYFLSNKKVRGKRIRLHRYVWEKENGLVPEGFHVHHKSADKSDNDISNLELMIKKDHLSLHGLDPKHKQMRINNILKYGVPAAIAWHKSESGSEWHKEHYQQFKHLLHKTKINNCQQCGKPYETCDRDRVRFCSNNCKSNHRRKSGIDDVERVCTECEKIFKVNKYIKKTTCSANCSKASRDKINRI